MKKLTNRGLPLRGSDEMIGSPHNGNFLMTVEILAEFDPFMREHLEKKAGKGKGYVSYI